MNGWIKAGWIPIHESGIPDALSVLSPWADLNKYLLNQ
jgi:hypothetical protein